MLLVNVTDSYFPFGLFPAEAAVFTANMIKTLHKTTPYTTCSSSLPQFSCMYTSEGLSGSLPAAHLWTGWGADWGHAHWSARRWRCWDNDWWRSWHGAWARWWWWHVFPYMLLALDSGRRRSWLRWCWHGRTLRSHVVNVMMVDVGGVVDLLWWGWG